MTNSPDQQHPQARTDRATVTQLLTSEPTDFNLAELARLRVRYRGFPGARDIQRDLETLLDRWQLDEESLFIKTRAIHAQGPIYKGRSNKQDEEDWS